MTYNPKNVWQPQSPPHRGWTSCSVWFGFAHVKLSVYPCAGFIFCFYNNSVRFALSAPCFTFREKKVPSWFGTRDTWESTQCQSSQRHRGNSFNFLFDLNIIQIMSPVQSGSFLCHTARPLSYPATAIKLKKLWKTLMQLKFLSSLLILQLGLSHPANNGLSKVVQLPINEYIDLYGVVRQFLVYFSWLSIKSVPFPLCRVGWKTLFQDYNKAVYNQSINNFFNLS